MEALKPLFTQDTTKQKKIVLDLFSGVGVFGLTVAHKIPNISKVIGYEIVKEAVMDANENAIMNNLSDKCKFYVRDLTKPGPLEGLEDKDDVTSEDADSIIEAIIVDPARPGCSKDILREIRTLRPKRIVYISCNPDTPSKGRKHPVRKRGRRKRRSIFFTHVPTHLCKTVRHVPACVARRDCRRLRPLLVK